MQEKKFLERCLETEQVFEGNLLHVFKDTVLLPGGRMSSREYIKHPGAAVIIPVLGKSEIIMVHQYRYPVGKVMLELPAGKIDPGEKPNRTIKRELEEETGYKASKVVKLGTIHPCVGYSSEILYLFWANQLSETTKQPDIDEKIEVFPIDISYAISLIFKGEITDGKSIVGLFWAERLMNDYELRKEMLGDG